MKYKLACFDLDGTLVDGIEFIWYVLHEHFNMDMAEVKRMHRSFLEGEISYEEWFAHDIRLWKKAGAVKKDFIEAVKDLKLMSGALYTIAQLKKKGLKLAIISGSLNIVTDYFFSKNHFDYVFINEIHFGDDGRISSYKATKYDFRHKATALGIIAKKEGLEMSECIFIGDNINDIDAVRAAGLGISFNSGSKELDNAADIVLKDKDLRKILDYVS